MILELALFESGARHSTTVLRCYAGRQSEDLPQSHGSDAEIGIYWIPIALAICTWTLLKEMMVSEGKCCGNKTLTGCSHNTRKTSSRNF